jgi:hypothetical protein
MRFEQWLTSALGTDRRMQKENGRLLSELLKVAWSSTRRSETGEPRLTTDAVASIRDGRAGNGCYKRMTKLLRATDQSAADWLWFTVAELQKQRKVSTDAFRPARGRRQTKGVQVEWIGWRGVLGTPTTPWWRMLLKAYEVVLRLQGNMELSEVPMLKAADNMRYYELLKKERGTWSRLVTRAAL